MFYVFQVPISFNNCIFVFCFTEFVWSHPSWFKMWDDCIEKYDKRSSWLFITIKEKISKDTFPNLFKMIKNNNYLRSNMSQERFSKLAILNIERDIIVDTEIILITFANKNRKIFPNIKCKKLY